MSLFKRILTAFLSVILTVCFAYSYGTVAFAEAQYANITGTNVRLRKEPSTESNYTVSLSNVKVQVNSTVQGEEAIKGKGTLWYNVTTLDGKNTGYVYGYYVEPTEFPSVPDEPVPYINLSFDEQLKKFPESYKAALTKLHKTYPNWCFVADNINMTLDHFIDLEAATLYRKQVPKSNCNAYKSMMNGAFDWGNNRFNTSNGGWCSASRQIIAYYIDPRNFLDEKQAFLFLDQSFDKATQTFDGLKATYSGTFLGGGYDENEDGTVSQEEKDAYFRDIMAAAEESSVNPYVLASKIAIEQGKGKSRLISGESGYYNFFNIGATGSTDDDVVKNGLARAEKNGWDTRRKSIVGGAVTFANGYINNGQCTNYYMDYNCVNYKNGTLQIQHQYAQNVADALSKSSWLQKAYEGNFSVPLIFKIPVFSSMPVNVYTKPEVSDKYNNFYMLDFEVDGLNTAFDKYKNNYSFKTDGNKSVFVKLHGEAKLQQKTYLLSKGTNVVNVTVISETGYSNTYIFSVNAASAGTLTLTTEKIVPPPQEPEEPDEPETPDEPQEPQEPEVPFSKGDINGDKAVDVIDLALIRMHLLKIEILTGKEFDAADINGDKAVDVIDLARIRLHILGLDTIK